MRHYLAFIAAWVGFLTLVFSELDPPAEPPMLIDAALETNASPDLVCIHVLTPGVMRRRQREVTNT